MNYRSLVWHIVSLLVTQGDIILVSFGSRIWILDKFMKRLEKSRCSIRLAVCRYKDERVTFVEKNGICKIIRVWTSEWSQPIFFRSPSPLPLSLSAFLIHFPLLITLQDHLKM